MRHRMRRRHIRGVDNTYRNNKLPKSKSVSEESSQSIETFSFCQFPCHVMGAECGNLAPVLACLWVIWHVSNQS